MHDISNQFNVSAFTTDNKSKFSFQKCFVLEQFIESINVRGNFRSREHNIVL